MRLPHATAWVVVGAVLACVLAGCISTKPEVAWEGKKVDEAIAEYGPPTRVSPSESGKTYVWEQRHTMQGIGAFPGATRETRVTIRMMTVDADGVITSYNRVDQ
jgi:hypothetical protein